MNNSTNQNDDFSSNLEGIIATLIGSFGIISNVVVCWISFTNRNHQKPLAKLITSLAASDLMISLCVTFMYIHQSLHANHSYLKADISDVFPKLLCKIWTFIIVTAFFASFLTLTVISIERYRHIMYPLKRITSSKRINLGIIACWQVAMIPTFQITLLNYKPKQESLNSCQIQFRSIYDVLFLLCSVILLLLIPIVILLFCYIMTLFKIYRSGFPMDISNYRRQIQLVTKARKKKTMIILLITIITILSHIPFMVATTMAVISNFNSADLFLLSKPFWFFYHSSWILSLLSGAINPILYNYCSQSFKEKIFDSLSKLSAVVRNVGCLKQKFIR